MKAALFSIIRFNNDTLDDWIMHHLSIGFEKIFICDNNIGMEDYPMSDYVITMCTQKRVKIFNNRNMHIDFKEELEKLSKSSDVAKYDCMIGLAQDEWFVTDKSLSANNFDISKPIKTVVRDMNMKINAEATMAHSLVKHSFMRCNDEYAGTSPLSCVIEKRSYSTVEQYMAHKLHYETLPVEKCIDGFFIFNKHADNLKKKIISVYNEIT